MPPYSLPADRRVVIAAVAVLAVAAGINVGVVTLAG
jgi:hypothetical protein